MKLHVTALPAFIASAALVAGVAHADPPGQVCTHTHEFFVTESDGSPSTGTVDVELRYFRSGVVAPSECRSFDSVPLDRGWARITVDACALPADDAFCGTTTINALLTAAAAAGTPLSVGAWVDGEEITPRFSLGAAPFAAYANSSGEAAFADECSTLGGYGADDFILASMPIDADTLDGRDSSAFLGAGDPIDADTLGGMSLSEILDMIGDGGAGGPATGGLSTRLTRTFENYDVPQVAATTTVTLDREIREAGDILSMRVLLDITHANTTEISRARLISPEGTTVELHGARAGVNIRCDYPATCSCGGATCLEAFVGENPQGTWSLELRDAVSGNPMRVDRFALVITYENPDTIADAPAVFTVGGRQLATGVLGGTGELGDLVVGPGQTHRIVANQIYQYRTLVVEEGGRIAGVGNGTFYLFASGDIVVRGTFDGRGRGALGGAAAPSAGIGGAGGAGLVLVSSGDIEIGDSAVIDLRGANGGAAVRCEGSCSTTGCLGIDGLDGAYEARYPYTLGRGALGTTGSAGAGGQGGRSITPPDLELFTAATRLLPVPIAGAMGAGGGGGAGGTRNYGGGGGGGGAGGNLTVVAGGLASVNTNIIAQGGSGGSIDATCSSSLRGAVGSPGASGQISVYDSRGDGGATCNGGVCTAGFTRVLPGSFISETGQSFEWTRSYLIAQTEVTFGQWTEITGRSLTPGPGSCTEANADCPMSVNYYSALAFLNEMSRREGLEACYRLTPDTCADSLSDDWSTGGSSTCTGATFSGLDCEGFRLPSDVEWELAYRAGTSTSTYAGAITVGGGWRCQTDGLVDEIAWYCANSSSRTRAVAQLRPNSLVLFDMAGNVSEWLLDGARPSAGSNSFLGFGAVSPGSWRLTAGGGFGSLSTQISASSRESIQATNAAGIRATRTLGE
jgi:subtilisin-like proprotein convertase family protein